VSKLLRRLRSEERGFTLIEMLATMSVLAVLFGIFSLILSNTIRDSSTIQDQSTNQTEVRAAIDGLAQDLRQGYTGDSSGTLTPISAISGTTLSFYSPDRAQPAFHLRQIQYQLTGGKLQRRIQTSTDTNGYPWTFGSWSAWATVASDITSSSIFTGKYLNTSGAVVTTSTPSQVSGVWIAVTVSPRGSQGRTYTYSTSASVRAAQ
jgi:prepilin-type N-terminal cleavage/methylation domain-containing protein